jgi:hypothetical protein
VTKVYAGFQQGLHRYDSHFSFSPFVFSSTPLISASPLFQALEPPITGCVALKYCHGHIRADTLYPA